MALNGNLADMAVADLIQHTCLDGKTACLVLEHAGRQAQLYFLNGAIVHAHCEERRGEEVVYDTLGWQDGQFKLEAGISPPERTIQRSWSSLLIDGAHWVDENRLFTPAGVRASDQDLGEADLAEIRGLGKIEDLSEIDIEWGSEEDPMAKKMDDVLKTIGEDVNGFMVAAVFGADGIGVCNYPPESSESIENINAQMAMLIKLVDTTVDKLGAGEMDNGLLTTPSAYLMWRYLEDKHYMIGIAIDRKVGNLGNLMMMSKLYADRVSKAMPRS